MTDRRACVGGRKPGVAMAPKAVAVAAVAGEVVTVDVVVVTGPSWWLRSGKGLRGWNVEQSGTRLSMRLLVVHAGWWSLPSDGVHALGRDLIRWIKRIWGRMRRS